MLPHHTTIASAAEVAARLPNTRRDGQGYRCRGYCHGSGDKPDSASLKFSDPSKPGEHSLARPLLQMQSQHAGRARRNPTRLAKGYQRPAFMQVSRLLGSTAPQERPAGHSPIAAAGDETAGYETLTGRGARPTVKKAPDRHRPILPQRVLAAGQARPPLSAAPPRIPISQWTLSGITVWPAKPALCPPRSAGCPASLMTSYRPARIDSQPAQLVNGRQWPP